MSTTTLHQESTWISKLRSLFNSAETVDVNVKIETKEGFIKSRIEERSTKKGKELSELEYQIISSNIGLYFLTDKNETYE